MRRTSDLLRLFLFGAYLCAAGAGCVLPIAAGSRPAAIQLWDTQWVLPVDTGQYDDRDIDDYFSKRREQGFDAIMTGATQFGLRNDSRLLRGGFPFLGDFIFSYGGENTPMGDITAPNPMAWDYVGGIVDRANRQGLLVGLLPMSNGGSKAYMASLQNEGVAYSFGLWLGRRFAAKPNLIWVLGGDVCPVEPALVDLTNALARGIRAGGARQPMTAHFGAIGSEENCDTSGAPFAGQSWFAFSMLQSSIPSEEQIDDYIRADVEKRGLPTGTGETVYEEFDYGNGFTGTVDTIRHRFFRTVFNGGFYFTYGHGQVMRGCLTDACLKYRSAAPSAIDMLAAAKHFLNERGMTAYRRDESFVSSLSGKVLPVSRGSSRMLYLAPGSSAVVTGEPSIVRIYDLARDLAYAHPVTEVTDGKAYVVDTAAAGDDALVTIDPR